MRKIKGFSLSEVIIVLVIISIILISIFGVFKYVLNNKVAYYVYNFYNELQYINKALEKNLRKNNQEYKDQLFTSILQKINAEEYCSAIADSINTIDKVDCKSSSNNGTFQEKLNKDVEYNCSRIWDIKIDDNGLVAGLTPDQQYSNCQDITSLADALNCNATPTSIISDAVINNTKYTYTYVCTKEKKVEEENTESLLSFNVDSKLGIAGNIKTANNINLAFLSFDNAQTLNVKYNLNTTLSQDHICPAFDTHSYNCSYSNESWNSDYWNSYSGGGNTHFLNYITPTLTKKNNQCVYNKLGAKFKFKLCAYRGRNYVCWDDSNYYSDDGNTRSYPDNISSCNERLMAARVRKDTNKLTSNKYTTQKRTGEFSNKCKNIRGNFWLKSNHKIVYSYDDTVKQYYDKYYKKWNNFFTNYGVAQQERIAINGVTYLEGSVESKISENVNTKHFIYAAIDKDFSKAEMKKDIFVFEQYGDKIIPVGYLANDKNSPLKFNVYTRSAQTGHLSRVARDITYCEAMSYVGGKVSEYCGCKDGKGNIVTEFEKHDSCGTLGCDLRAVKPNFKSVWLPSK